MKATCDRDKLLRAFQMAASVVPRGARNPSCRASRWRSPARRPSSWEPIWRWASGSRSPAFRSSAWQRDPAARPLRQDPDGELRRKARSGERRQEDPGPRTTERVSTAVGKPGRVSRRACLRGGEVPRAAGPVLPRGGPPHRLRHGQREQPLCVGGRVGRNDGQPIDGRRHRRPPAGPAGGAGQVGRWTRHRRPHHDYPHPSDAIDRAGPGRQRGQRPTGRPRQRRARQERADDDLYAAWSRADTPSGATFSHARRGW